jgi:predicted Fe-Mo cluster-binding NifX family protein
MAQKGMIAAPRPNRRKEIPWMGGNSESLIVAFASGGATDLPKRHFGEARQFDLYRLAPAGADWIRTVANPYADTGHSDDEHHKKGAELVQLLGRQGVQVIVSRAFGPNIKGMRRWFLPVVVGCEEAEQAIALLQARWDLVRSHWMQGEERRHLVLRGQAGPTRAFI